MQAPASSAQQHGGSETPWVHRPLSLLLTGLRGLSPSPNTKKNSNANCTTANPA